MVKNKFRSIQKMMEHTNQLEQIEPYTEKQLEKDVELAEGDNYEVLAKVRSKGALTFKVPDLSTVLGVMKTEAGMVVVDGFGRAKIDFDTSFDETPGMVSSIFGFFELKVPWVTLRWEIFRIGRESLRLPIPKVKKMTIRLPTMCFLMNIDKTHFEVFNVAGRTNISYLAIGR